MKLKKRLSALALFLPLTLLLLSVSARGESYTFSFDGNAEARHGELDAYITSLPEDIQNQLPDGANDTTDASKYSFSYFAGLISDALSDAVPSALKTFSALLCTIILCAAFRILARTVASSQGLSASLDGAFSLCSVLCASLALWQIEKSVFDAVQGVLDTISSAMLTIVPVMEAVYISSGNAGTAAVSGTGMNLMITFCESLYADVLSPAAGICFILATAAAVTGNRGVSFMSKTIRGIITGVLVFVMALMSFVLALQTSAAGAADGLAAKAIRFAIGSYMPIVGGSVSESFSFLAGSLSVIRRFCGVTGIVVIVIAFAVPLCVIIANRLAIAVSGAVAGMLGCERERELLVEAGSICTLMLAVTVCAGVMFIIALAVFCRTPAAFG